MTRACRVRRLAQHQDALAQEDRLLDVVGHDDGRQPGLLAQLHRQPLQVLAGQRVQRGERLVHQQQVGLLQQAAGDGRALALAAADLAGVLVPQLGDAQPLQPVVTWSGVMSGRG